MTLSLQDISQSGILTVLGITWMGGLLTAFTPCVYPLIPIILGVMGARGEVSRLKSFLLSFFFVLGLSTVYSVLGFFAATSGQILGAQLNSPTLVLFVASVFAFMGLSLLGLFEFRLPMGINNFLSQPMHQTGLWGSFLLGAVSGLLAAPCSGPVIVGILAYVAQKSNPGFGLGLLFLFGFGLGFPFLILGTFSHLLKRIPKTGYWSEWIKRLCGFALIAAAFIYLDKIFPKPILLGMMGIGFILISIFMKKVFPLPERFEIFQATLRTIFAVFAGVALLQAMETQKAAKEIKQPKAIVWVTNLDEGLKLAQQKNKLIMIDVWATWCDACTDLDNKTYTDSQVQKILSSDFVSIKVDATDPSLPTVEPFIKKYGITGLPTILFLDSKGEPLSSFIQTGFIPPIEFVGVLEKVRKTVIRP